MRLTERHWALAGWWLFVACAVFFIASAWRAGDPLALIGSLCFMAALRRRGGRAIRWR